MKESMLSQQDRLKTLSRNSVTMSTQSLFDDGAEGQNLFPKTEEQEEWLLGIVADNALFLKLNQKQCRKIVSSFKLEEIEADKDLITQGTHSSDTFYVVEGGEFDVFVDGNYVSTLPRGACLGELGIVNSGPRTATCKANQASKVWAVQRTDIQGILQTNPKHLKKQRTMRRKRNRKRRMIKKTEEETDWLQGILMQEKLFQSLNPHQLLTVCQQMYLENLDVEDVLIKQGEIDQSFYVVKSGEFNILVDGNVVHAMGRGSCFGDLALVEMGPRTATCQANRSSSVWKLDKVAWRKIQVQPTNLRLNSTNSLNNSTPSGSDLTKSEEKQSWLMEVISHNNIFSQITLKEKQQVVNELFLRNVPKEKQLVSQGDKSIQSFYVVESGEFDVFLDGNHIHSIPKGGCFGDLKLTDEPAQATCRANQDSVVWTIKARRWSELKSSLITTDPESESTLTSENYEN